MSKLRKSRTSNRAQDLDRSILSRTALTRDAVRLARIKAKAPQHRTNAELAYEETAELALAFSDERAAIIAGALDGLGLDSAFLVVTAIDERGRYRFACAISDPAGHFAGAS